MLSRLLILLMILVLSSVIWWPGLNDASSFENLSELHLKDTSQKVGSLFESMKPVVDGVHAKVSGAFNALLGDDYLPSAEVDGHKDAPTKEFFTRLWSSPYFVSMRAMLEMSCVRAILAMGWFAFLSPILIAVVIDAWVVRRLKFCGTPPDALSSRVVVSDRASNLCLCRHADALVYSSLDCCALLRGFPDVHPFNRL